MGKSMNPCGGNDRVYTPGHLAAAIVNHFQPSGICLDPCEGFGAFSGAMKALNPTYVFAYEIDQGRDFLAETGECARIQWTISNPPWSKFMPFLERCMAISDNVVFLANLNAWVTKARMRAVFDAGFGFKETLLVDTPPPPWPQMGFQLAATHIQRGYTGDMRFSRL